MPTNTVHTVGNTGASSADGVLLLDSVSFPHVCHPPFLGCRLTLLDVRTHMTRDELVKIVRDSNSDTLIAARFRETLGLPKLVVTKRQRHKHRGNRKKYRWMDECRKQRHGVRL